MPATRLASSEAGLFFFFGEYSNVDEVADHYLFLIDTNKFKSINDVHGHIQGDQALVRIAEMLRFVCRNLPRRANIARYGGDEFVILAATDDPDTLCRQIHERLAAINATDPVPYELTVSIGVTKAEIGTSLVDAIAEADKRMFQEKKGICV